MRKSVKFFERDQQKLDTQLDKADLRDRIRHLISDLGSTKDLLEGKFNEKVRAEEEKSMQKNPSIMSTNTIPTSMKKQKTSVMGKGGKFVRFEGAKFDIILNILIGIRRSLSTIVRLPGQQLTDWQFKKKIVTESDWVD